VAPHAAKLRRSLGLSATTAELLAISDCSCAAYTCTQFILQNVGEIEVEKASTMKACRGGIAG